MRLSCPFNIFCLLLGYLAYVSFLRIELSHCNPVVLTFCELLLTRKKVPIAESKDGMTNLASLSESVEHEQNISTSRHIRHWYKLYTLIRNPSLVSQTKNNFTKAKSDEDALCGVEVDGSYAANNINNTNGIVIDDSDRVQDNKT